MTIQPYRDRFITYAESFLGDDPDIARNMRLKIDHSLRVLDEITGLADALALTGKRRLWARLAGLFHDIGRFEQYTRFRTFYDKQSVDHARLAVDILRRDDILAPLEPTGQRIVLDAIQYHNRAFVPEIADASSALISRMLRDADKLDIFRVMIEHWGGPREGRNPAIEFNLPESDDISPRIVEDLRAGRLIEYGHIRNRNDFRLVQLGWVYDLNFAHSFQCVRDRAYLPSLRRQLPDSARINEVFELARRHVERRC
jgi:putative nucleotidyltransferase with HDIG domain